VLHHSRGSFGISPSVLEGYPLEQAVAFFFVLSGFILTYVYPTLEEIGWKRFLLGRFARIWPAHVAALVLLFALLPLSLFGPSGRLSAANLLGNLLMVQAWVPIGGQFFSYNSPSWSISTEFGFYLLFPILIHRWEKTWRLKLLVAFAVTAGMIAVAAFGLPRWGAGHVSIDDLVYSHPLGRVFEFTIGMTAALFWRRLSAHIRPGRIVGTVLEMAALGLVFLAVAQGDAWWAGVYPLPGFGPALALWLVRGGSSCVPFAVLIVVMALQAGWIARLLATPLLVLLGEISYSIYLVHQIFLRAAGEHAPYLSRIPDGTARVLFLVLVLVVAHLIWLLVERPARLWLVGLWPARATASVAANTAELPTAPRTPSFRGRVAMAEIGLVLVLLALVAWRFGVGLDRVGVGEANRLAAAGVPAARGVRFGNRFELLGARIQVADSWLTIDLVWRSLRDQTLDRRVGVHLTDSSGAIRTQADYAQSIAGGSVEEGALWRETISVPRSRLAGSQNLALAVYDLGSVLEVDRGPRDWNNTRLVLLLPQAAGL
jgi:peptidoglycan/LPS O-acetylase OafA/YrhL